MVNINRRGVKLMRVVMLEPLGVEKNYVDNFSDKLKAEGHEFVYYDNRVEEPKVLIERAEGADVLILSNISLSAEVINSCPQLKMLSVAFTGVDHIDLAACKENNITVCNAPGYSTDSVAELAFGFMISLLRKLNSCDTVTREGKTRDGLIGNELKGKTIGIIGTGAIGMRVAEIANVFGCKLIGYNRSQKKRAKELGMDYVELDTLMAESDIVSIHIPFTEETRSLIDQEKIKLMKDSALLINTARGPIVDSEPLAEALKRGDIAGVGVDIFEMEPPIPQDHPLINAPNTVLAPHVAFATDEAFENRIQIVFNNIFTWLEEKTQNKIV
jgi:D-3-phosphoglycerate dehydrogenase